MLSAIVPLLRCPLCGGAFSRQAGSLVCPNRHTYDIARQGYVNFVPGKRVIPQVEKLFAVDVGFF